MLIWHFLHKEKRARQGHHADLQNQRHERVSFINYLAACAHMYTLLNHYTAKFRSAIAGKRCEGAAEAGAAAVAADAFSTPCTEADIAHAKVQSEHQEVHSNHDKLRFRGRRSSQHNTTRHATGLLV